MGVPAAPTATAAEFVDVPTSRTLEDIYTFGLFDNRDRLLGTLIAVSYYLDEQT